MTDVVEVPRYRGAVNQIGSGAFTAAKGSLQLALLLAGYGFSGIGLLGRAALVPARRGRAATRAAAASPDADEVRVVEIVPRLGLVGRLRSMAFRVGLAAVVVGGLAAGAAAFAKIRAKQQLPEPAAAPPAVRPSSNGTGNLVTYVDQGSTNEN